MIDAAERLELVLSERRIRRRVAALGRSIDADYRDKQLTLVVVLKGAWMFAADLARQITIPFAIDFVTAASYGASTQSSGTVVVGAMDALDLAGHDILVIEDILDTGQTTMALLDAMRRRSPASLAICTLLRKQRAAALDLPARYVGFEIPDDFVVGYGMDYAERYRNLPAVYRLVIGGEAGEKSCAATTPTRLFAPGRR